MTFEFRFLSFPIRIPEDENVSDVQVLVDPIMTELWFVLVYVLPVIMSQCPSHVTSRIQECVRPVAEYAKILNNDQITFGNDLSTSSSSTSEFGNAFSLPKIGRRVFNELCKLIAKFNVCVNEYRMQCLRHITISLIDSSYGYLCNEGYNKPNMIFTAFMESAECLMELDRKPTVKRCHDETLVEIETANIDSNISMAAKLDRMCGALNFFASCVKTPIKQECGLSAWQVIYRVLKDTTNTLMPGCQFLASSTKRIPYIETTAKAQILTTAHLPLTTSTSLMTNFKGHKDTMKIPINRQNDMNRNVLSQQLSQLNANHRLNLLLTLISITILFNFNNGCVCYVYEISNSKFSLVIL
ncbi:hypothetical protein DICVIV_04836 [Dictyocaulus viviparus]|uniref:DUF19 domain-containing protein n=1 Tax=Dictyocaulus viviparus TaxID=29172 RepID=A0A0D8XYX4_DICVI|nr:hypothetical protein DICVIV_04836 [Dictyocaulus viviparus]